MSGVVLITGAAGFLGSHLCDRFHDEGFRVIAMDNLVTGRLSNIDHLLSSDRFQFLHHDVTKYIDIQEKVDYILHFASPASPNDYLDMPIQTLKAGSLGTHNLLGLAKENKAIFMIASTSEVYGDPLVHPQDENYWGNVNPIGPRGVYDEAKRFQEAITMAYHNYHKIDIRIARIFNTYGPRMRINDGRVLPTFFMQAMQNRDITIFGDGSQTRSFCFVDDLIDGLFRLLNSKYNQPVNFGNPSEVSIRKLAYEVKNIVDSKSKFAFKDLPIDDPKVRRPCIKRANEILKWKPEIDRQEGLIKTYGYFKSILNLNR